MKKIIIGEKTVINKIILLYLCVKSLKYNKAFNSFLMNIPYKDAKITYLTIISKGDIQIDSTHRYKYKGKREVKLF